MSQPRLLFLCTGNYYRSRFAEILFNALAPQHGMGWRADSRALALERGIHNAGPISTHAVRGLEARGVTIELPIRAPQQVIEADLATARHIVAVKEAEHRPLVRDRFPNWLDQIEYWHIDDIDFAPPERALDELERQVQLLAQRLCGRGPACRVACSDPRLRRPA